MLRLHSDVGLDTFYTHHQDTCNGHVIDPINVAWYEAPAAISKISDAVASELQNHSFMAWRQMDPTDSQGVRNLFFQCTNEATDDATGVFFAPDRNHVRIFNTYTKTTYYAVGDAHHDSGKTCYGSSDFLGPKRDIYQYFHDAHRFENWGNTRPIYQSCINQNTASNGYVAVMQALQLAQQ